jgi:hypothetical protein
LTQKLAIAVNKIVIGIRNSIIVEGKSIQLRVLKAKVAECPMVKAVIRTNNFFQSVHWYLRVNTSTKRI